MGHLNSHIHGTVADLLQVILSRGELELPMLKRIETALLFRLFLCVHRRSLDLQNKLLHVLHSAISSVSSLQKKTSRKGQGDGNGMQQHKSALETHPPPSERDSFSSVHDPLLTRVLVDGISTQRSSAVIHHWIDFLLMTVPTFRQSLHSVLIPLVDCLAAKLFALVDELWATYDPARKGKEAASDATDADYVVLINAYERLLLAAIESSRAGDGGDEVAPSSSSSADRSAAAESSTGFLGYVTNVLGTSDSHSASTETVPRVSFCSLLSRMATVLSNLSLNRRKAQFSSRSSRQSDSLSLPGTSLVVSRRVRSSKTTLHRTITSAGSSRGLGRPASASTKLSRAR
jgi:hypothetical protein